MVLKKIFIKVKKLHPDAKIPIIAKEHSAGFDLYSNEEVIIMPGETKLVGTGISMELPEGTACFLWDRSGIGAKGIHRFAGLIDSSYRGEYKVVLSNHSKEPFKIEKGERIAQGVIQDYYEPIFQEVEELSNTSRGEGGFGSTGKK